jgi:hypothetical protein
MRNRCMRLCGNIPLAVFATVRFDPPENCGLDVEIRWVLSGQMGSDDGVETIAKMVCDRFCFTKVGALEMVSRSLILGSVPQNCNSSLADGVLHEPPCKKPLLFGSCHG